MTIPHAIVVARRDVCRACPQAAAPSLTNLTRCKLAGQRIAVLTVRQDACPAGYWPAAQPMRDPVQILADADARQTICLDCQHYSAIEELCRKLPCRDPKHAPACLRQRQRGQGHCPLLKW